MYGPFEFFKITILFCLFCLLNFIGFNRQDAMVLDPEVDSDDHEEDNDRGEGTSSSSTVCSNCEQLQMQFKEELAFNSATHEKVVLALEKKIVEEGEKCRKLQKELEDSKRKIDELQGIIDKSDDLSLNAPAVAKSLGRIIRGMLFTSVVKFNDSFSADVI